MSIKIDLEGIKDNRNYAIVAYLVDNDHFLEEVVRVRKLIGIGSPLGYVDATKWLNRKLKGISKKDDHGNDMGISVTSMNKADKEHFRNRTKLSINVGTIKERFEKGLNFTQIIVYAILAGKVTDNECTLSSFCASYPFSQKFDDAEFYTEQPMVAIFVNPETKLKEVKTLMDTKVKELFDKKKRIDTSTKRERTNIKRDRKWYWENHSSNPNRLGYIKIAKKNKGISSSTVRDAIDQYKDDMAVRV